MDTHLVNLDWSGLEVLGDEDCLHLLDAAPIGRLGFMDQGSPVILPVNFALDGRSIVFRSAAGSKLTAAVVERPVCLEVDGWDAVEHSGWSVLAKGVARHIVDDDERGRLASARVRPWSNPELRDEWVRIVVDELTGRRIG
jgi:nitroimidazol reductase NimA-like FMN-containing flavoprotein (pyridoxamine 5'-phosphate oxidase superfamily)